MTLIAGVCYMYVVNAMSWPDAEQFCNNMHPGVHLVSITSRKKLDSIKQLGKFVYVILYVFVVDSAIFNSFFLGEINQLISQRNP
jgi:hypothetical protein